MKGKSELDVAEKRGIKQKRMPGHENIRSWWKGISETCVDEIILNPKSLWISCLILMHSSQVIAVVREQCFAFLFGSVLCALSSRMNYPSDSSLWIFCLLASKQKFLNRVLLQSTSAANQYLITIHKVINQLPSYSPEAFLYFYFLINNTVFSCFSLLNLPIDILPLWLTLRVL